MVLQPGHVLVWHEAVELQEKAKLLDDCRRMAERLIELSKGQSALHQKQGEISNDTANESYGSDA